MPFACVITKMWWTHKIVYKKVLLQFTEIFILLNRKEVLRVGCARLPFAVFYQVLGRIN